jgi:hypothetical protein
MGDMTRQSRLGAGLVAVMVVTTAFRGGQALTRQDSVSMQHKLDAIAARGTETTARTARSLRTSFTEREVNAYFKYDGAAHLPAGVVDPQIVIADNGQVEGKAIVDLEAVRKAQPSAILDLVAMFAGAVEVRAVGRLTTADGKGTFALDRASVGGLPVPKSLLQALVTHYSRNPDLPDGFNLDKPFELPAAIRFVETQRGAATIVQ